MSTVFILIGLVLLVGVIVWLIFRGADHTLAAMSETPLVVVAPPVQEPPRPLPPAPIPTVQIRLLSEKGNVIGATKIAAKARKQQMTFTTGKSTKGVFQAREMDKGVWIYQRVGIER